MTRPDPAMLTRLVDRIEEVADHVDAYDSPGDSVEVLRRVVVAWWALPPLVRDGIASQLTRRAEVVLGVALDLDRPATPTERAILRAVAA